LRRVGFSALQRAENSSIFPTLFSRNCSSAVSVLFSEPKIPQYWIFTPTSVKSEGFSALQRAENSSIQYVYYPKQQDFKFQCSSASRKFLNRCGRSRRRSSSWVSVLFSEPKIPQSQRSAGIDGIAWAFQCSSASRKFLNASLGARGALSGVFQCSSASRKFLNQEL